MGFILRIGKTLDDYREAEKTVKGVIIHTSIKG